MPRNQQEIEQRVNDLNAEVRKMLDAADAHIDVVIEGRISFRYQVNGPVAELTSFERAQATSFVTKYDSLPEIEPLDIREHNGRFYPNNIDSYRHLLNEYRSIIQNNDDSTHYSRVHNLCREKLVNAEDGHGLSINAIHENDGDITEQFTRLLNQKNRAINRLIQNCEFDYIYNGILQHSDERFSQRYVRDYNSGELHYIFVKHSMICGYIQEELRWHHYLLKVLAGVIMGPL